MSLLLIHIEMQLKALFQGLDSSSIGPPFPWVPRISKIRRTKQCAVKQFCCSSFTFRTWNMSVCVKISVRNHLPPTSTCKLHTLLISVLWVMSEASLPRLLN